MGMIQKLKSDCDIRDLADCNETVTEACPDQCADVNATLENDSDMMTGGKASESMAKPLGSEGRPCAKPIPNCLMEGEQYASCQSSSCFEATCDNGQLKKPGPICTADCKKGCRCMDGWARNISGGECLTEGECSAQADTGSCGMNEEFEDCGSSSCWERHCQDGQVITPGPMCTFDCRQGCKCSSGFVRDRTANACIPELQCLGKGNKLGKGKFGKGKKGKLVGKNGNTRVVGNTP
jgi:hypothetical protein